MVRPNQVVSVRHPEHGGYITPSMAEEYDENDPLVVRYPWLFTEPETDTGPIKSVSIERATRAPGERRQMRRPRRV